MIRKFPKMEQNSSNITIILATHPMGENTELGRAMDSISKIDSLRAQITEHETKLIELKKELSALQLQDGKGHQSDVGKSETEQEWQRPLRAAEYPRYGRQMILPGFGLSGQLNLRKSKVLLVGLGGLGCPAAAYLAGAGVGTLGLVDGDVVEVSNVHRQILHSTAKVGWKKVDSAVDALTNINPNTRFITYKEHLTPVTALEIFPDYDLILDCTDTPQTRYLISDTAVICGKPLISASALRMEGQLSILNHPPTPPLVHRNDTVISGPCYRCVFPRPPPPESVMSCGDGGILGPVVGTMGTLMALETIKILVSDTKSPKEDLKHSMLMLSASENGPSVFRSIRLRGKRTDCPACGTNASITSDYIKMGNIDYTLFCGASSNASILDDKDRIKVEDFAKAIQYFSTDTTRTAEFQDVNWCQSSNRELHSPIILDVRDDPQFSICSIPGSINIPWARLQIYRENDDEPDALSELKLQMKRKPTSQIYTICRLGNDSQLAVRKLKELQLCQDSIEIKDVVAGFKAWKAKIDKNWPDY